MVLHVSKHVVVNVAEEFDFGLNAPIISSVLESGMMVEHPTIPAAHLMVRLQCGILDIVLLQNLRAFIIQLMRDPLWRCPMLLRYGLIVAFRFGESLRLTLKFFSKGDIVKKRPRIVEFVVPVFFKLLHGWKEVMEFLIADEYEEGGIDARRIWVVRSISIGPP